MTYCDEHKAHAERFERIDARLETVERKTDEIERLIARIDALVDGMQKLQWILVTAIAGMTASWILRIPM